MSPPFYRDWWLAAALTSTALPVGVAQAAQIPDSVGVVTALSAGSAPPMAAPPCMSAATSRLACACKPMAKARCMCCFWINPR